MLTLSNLKPKYPKRNRKRVGRGLGSGHGAYSGRGIKGQKARTGGGIKAGFEGGRMPLVRQMPKQKGFRSIHAKNRVVNLRDLERVFKNGDLVTVEALQKLRLVRGGVGDVKVLGTGKLNKSLSFEKKLKLSASAKKAVVAAGGKIQNAE